MPILRVVIPPVFVSTFVQSPANWARLAVQVDSEINNNRHAVAKDRKIFIF